ncbi:MAG: hypothetical protein E6J91_24855 [Deltaproteobacteria bacterium]|nr:MAG: hypothetical protein E6J91_24855 [Deltaproteobacteria bacterium]
MGVVDHALRAVRQLVAQRSPLILHGEGDLISIAAALHRLALGEAAPFVVCDPRRGNTPASVRSAASFAHGIEAFVAAIGGSVCIRRKCVPPDLGELMQRLLAPESEVRLFVCASPSRTPAITFTSSMTVELPPLPLRENEIPRIIEDYAADSARTLPEIAKGTLRVVALNTSPSFTDAAKCLGMAQVSLVRWVGRRAPLPHAPASLPRSFVPAAPRSSAGAA